MSTIDTGHADLHAALMELNTINSHVICLTSMGMERKKCGAEMAWLRKAVRAALMPAGNYEEVELKNRLLAGNVEGWALQAAQANGLMGSAGLIMGALAAEAHDWNVVVSDAHDGGGVHKPLDTIRAAFAPGVLASYGRDADPLDYGLLLECYEELVAEVAMRSSRGDAPALLADAKSRMRETFLDVITVTTRTVVQLEQKQSAYLKLPDLNEQDAWMFAMAANVALQADYRLLGLSKSEVKRLKAMFPRVWTSNERPPEYGAAPRSKLQ